MPHALFRRQHLDAGVRQEAHGVVEQIFHRHEHIVALAEPLMRKRQLVAGMGLPFIPRNLSVDGPGAHRSVYRTSASEHLLDHQ